MDKNNKNILIIAGVASFITGVLLIIVGFVTSIYGLTIFGVVLTFSSIGIVAAGSFRKLADNGKREIVSLVRQIKQEESGEEKPDPSASDPKDELGEETAEVIVCGSCGAKNEKGDRYCHSCGSPLVFLCPHCGAKTHKGDTYCRKCGELLKLPL